MSTFHDIVATSWSPPHARRPAAIKTNDLGRILPAVGGLLRVPAERFWVDYHSEADVPCLRFRKPQGADESQLRDNNVIVRTHRGEIVGLTILEASKK